MPLKKTHRQKNIAKARASRWATSDKDSEGLRPIERYTSPMTADRFSDPEEEENSWDGGVHVPDSMILWQERTALTKKAWWNSKGKSWSKISGN